MKHLLALMLSIGVSLPAFGTAETYLIDTSNTVPRFRYQHFIHATQVNRFEHTTGIIVLDRAARTGSVEVVIDTSSVNTGSAELDRHIQGEYGLDSVNHPTITFKSTGLDFADDALVSVDGNLTVKGVTRPVTLQLSAFRCIMQACGASAHTTIRRSDYNAGALIPYVEDELNLNIVIEAVRQ